MFMVDRVRCVYSPCLQCTICTAANEFHLIIHEIIRIFPSDWPVMQVFTKSCGIYLLEGNSQLSDRISVNQAT